MAIETAPKSFLQSKTIWANIIGAGVTIAGVFGLDLGLTPESQAQLVAGIMVVVNIILRFVTNGPVK